MKKLKTDMGETKPEIEACAGRVAEHAQEVSDSRQRIQELEKRLASEKAILATAMLNHLVEFGRLKDLSQILQPTI